MLVYLPNDDVAPIIDYINRARSSIHIPTSREAEALARMFKQMDAEKNGAPYQMWLRDKEKRHAHDSAASAGPVAADRPSGRNRDRKNNRKRKK